jgi:hypothetical protein
MGAAMDLGGVPGMALACWLSFGAAAWAQEPPAGGPTPAAAGQTWSDSDIRARPPAAGPPLDQQIESLGDPPKPTAGQTTTTTTSDGDTGLKPGLGYKFDGGLGGYGGLKYGGYDPHNSTTTTEETACSWKPVDGWIQPVQGVFQDDPIFPTAVYDYAQAPKPNPLIEQRSPGVLRADLPMVAGRDTVITGVARYWYNGERQPGEPRATIVLNGVGDCRSTVGVKVRFVLNDIKGSRVLYTSDVTSYIPIRGGATGRPPAKFQVVLPAFEGMPPQAEGAFHIAGPGPYSITAEALDAADDKPIGLQVTVSGQAVVMKAPVVEFIPVSLSGFTSASAANDFGAWVDDLTEASHRFLPDYFPLVAEGLTTFSRDPINLASFDPHLEDATANREALAARITDRVGAAGVLSGAGRVVVVLRKGAQAVQDYDRAAPDDSAAFSSSTKVIFLSVHNGIEAAAGIKGQQSTPNFEPAAPEQRPNNERYGSSQVETVGHELIHTLPDLIWSGTLDARHNMKDDCGLNDHNLDLHTGYGLRIDIGGIESARAWQEAADSMMGGASRPYIEWITQCAYAHLIASFPIAVDPKVMMVRTIVSRRKGEMAASLAASYDGDGVVDVVAGPAPDWAIIVRPAGGGVETRYPFTPVWATDDNYPRDTLAILVRIPEPIGAGTLAVAFKGKTLISRPFSADMPSLRVTSSASGLTAKGAKVALSWAATGAGGAPVLSSVFYSDNGGDFYRDQLFEQTADHWTVSLNPRAKDHVIKVVVSDQGRSREQRIRLTTP